MTAGAQASASPLSNRADDEKSLAETCQGEDGACGGDKPIGGAQSADLRKP